MTPLCLICQTVNGCSQARSAGYLSSGLPLYHGSPGQSRCPLSELTPPICPLVSHQAHSAGPLSIDTAECILYISILCIYFIKEQLIKLRFKDLSDSQQVSILHPAFMKYVHDVWLRKKAAYPSTGFLAVVLSLLMCDEVNVFGFGADSEGNWSHYFEILKNKRLKTGGHPGEEEYKMIVKLHMKKKIVFFKGW
uniref:ST3 beta-galactoside alpha-2,3-sialyltransferase 1 n=1 Tax=Neolamprologus brichardi TaxID=32507 RepID=A0A3Q4G4E6_NEOBR